MRFMIQYVDYLTIAMKKLISIRISTNFSKHDICYKGSVSLHH
jgi:hypothetical protein